MTLRIVRFKEGSDWTIGRFGLLDDKGDVLVKGYSLEPAGPDTTMSGQDKRIPEGVYGLEMSYSPKYGKKMPLVFNENVSKNRRILIHVGNYGRDTLGCILLGASYSDGAIWNSTITFNKVRDYMLRDDCYLEIKNDGL